MGSFAADHVISDPDAFADAVRLAVDAGQGGLAGDHRHRADPSSRPPSATSAGEPLPDRRRLRRTAVRGEAVGRRRRGRTSRRGSYRWNAGMFVVRPGSCWTCSRDVPPRASPPTCARSPPTRTLARDLAALPRIALDHAVAEPAADAGRVAVVPGDLRLVRRRRLRLPGRPAAAATAGSTRPRGRGPGARAWTRPGWSSPAGGGRSPWSASTTSWSWTPATRCW